MNQSITSLLLSFLFLIMPFSGNAVVDIKPNDASNQVQKSLTTSDFSTLDKNGLEKKVGRKLKLKEKIILKLFQRKLRKQAKKKSGSGEVGDGGSFGLGISVAGLILGVFSFVATSGTLLFLSFLFGLAGLTVSLFALEKCKRLYGSRSKRNTALVGVFIGMLVSVFWMLLLVLLISGIW